MHPRKSILILGFIHFSSSTKYSNSFSEKSSEAFVDMQIEKSNVAKQQLIA